MTDFIHIVNSSSAHNNLKDALNAEGLNDSDQIDECVIHKRLIQKRMKPPESASDNNKVNGSVKTKKNRIQVPKTPRIDCRSQQTQVIFTH